MRVKFKLILIISLTMQISALDLDYDYIDNSIEKCSNDGSHSKLSSCKISDNFYKTSDVCKISFELACNEKLEKLQCEEGIRTARMKKICNSLSDVSKKCCQACLIGLELKKSTCDVDLKSLSKNTNLVVQECCNENVFDNEDYSNENEEETKAINDDYDILLVPEALTDNRQLHLTCHQLMCDKTEECVESATGPNCVCKKGFETKGETCVNINECQNGLHNCSSSHKHCVDSEGSFKCEGCVKGFEVSNLNDYGDESEECTDINECAEAKTCPDNHICENLKGSFKCIKKCNQGFRIDSLGFCEDIDECKTNPCRRNEHCSNIKASFRCTNIECPPRFISFHNTTNCVLEGCKTFKHCPKTISRIFKFVEKSESNVELYGFYSNNFKTSFNSDFFKLNSSEGAKTLILKKPLPYDEVAEITIRKGGQKHVKIIYVFVSN